MDIGSGVAIAGGAFSIVAVVYRVLPSKSNGKYNESLCEEKHLTIDKCFDRIETQLVGINKKLDEIMRRE